MAESVFRSSTPAPTQATSSIATKNDASTTKDSGIEVPYLDYEAEHGKPYLAEHFQLGDKWSDIDGGFPQEISEINTYIQEKIKSGETPNSVKAIKELINGMEKMNNLTKEERPVVKLEVLHHYIQFLQANDQTRKNLRRYNGF